MPIEGDWYIARDGQSIGPISDEEFRARARSGEIGAADLIWREGFEDWRKAGDVPGFMPRRPPPLPPPNYIDVIDAPNQPRSPRWMILVYFLLVPITVLNVLGGIVCYVWLILLGQWRLAALGFVALIVSSFWLGLALAPGLLFQMPAIGLLQKRRHVIGGILLTAGQLWTYAVMFAWSYGVYLVGMGAWLRAPEDSLYPYLLWVYSTATGPFTFAAAKDQESIASFIAAFAICVAMVAVIALAFLGLASFEALSAALIVPMVLALAVQTMALVEMAKAGAFEE